MDSKRKDFAHKLIGSGRAAAFRSDVIESIMNGGHKPSYAPQLHPNYRSPEERKLRTGEKCTPSVCFSCHNTCECLVYTDAVTGDVLRVEGDPESPQTHGRLCAKGLSAADLVYNPERLKKPLKNTGNGRLPENCFRVQPWQDCRTRQAVMRALAAGITARQEPV